MAIDGDAVAILHPVDQARRDFATAVDQHGVSGGEALQIGFTGAKRHRQLQRQTVVDMETLGDFAHPTHADIAGQPHGHQIA